MYDVIKHIATGFYIKCSKYKKEELTPELRDELFDEAFNEYGTMESINNKLIERNE